MKLPVVIDPVIDAFFADGFDVLRRRHGQMTMTPALRREIAKRRREEVGPAK